MEEKWARRECGCSKGGGQGRLTERTGLPKTWRRLEGAHSALNCRQSQGKCTGVEDRVVVVMLLMVMVGR